MIRRAGIARSLPIAGVAFALVVAHPALAADESDPITTAIDQLDAEDLRTRESATESLLTSNTLTVEFVEATLRRAGLSPEQHRRLMSVGRKHFGESPRAAMGIMFGQEAEQGVTIRDTIERFDAKRKLRPDDTVIAIDGQPLLGREQMRYEIVSRDPGDVMHLSILRNGAPLEIDLELGQFKDLDQSAASLDSYTLSRAWEMRLTRKGIAAWSRNDPIDCRPPIGIDVPIGAFALADMVDYESRPIAGGRPRDGLARSAAGMYNQDRLVQARREIQAEMSRHLNAQPDLNEAARQPKAQVEAAIRQLVEERTHIERRVEATRRLIADTRTPESQQLELRRIYNNDQTLIRIIDSRTRDLERILGGGNEQLGKVGREFNPD